MRWIGQHIWDFISRFRNDIYLEATETGTIASGGNLGLDSNNKIVKAGDALSFDGSTANGVLTYGNASTIDVESTLTYGLVANTLKIGGDDVDNAFISRASHTSDDGGDLYLTSGSPTFIPGSTNKSSGDLFLRTGFSTGNNTGGSIKLQTVQAVLGSGTGLNQQADTVTIHGYNVHLEEDVTLSFEGATDNGYETTLTVADPSAARTITLPNATGTVALTHFAIPSDGAGNADGDIVYIGTGSTVIGKIYYYKSDGSWGLTNSDDPSTATGWLAVALGDDPDVDGMLVRGMIDLAGNIVGTEALGSIIYLDKATTGDATTAAPTATGDIVRVIGYAVTTGDANKIWFNPDNTWVEHV
jgi:hypothetical protein